MIKKNPRTILFLVNDLRFFLSHRKGLATFSINQGLDVIVAGPSDNVAEEKLNKISKELEEKKTDLIDEYKDFFNDIEDLNNLQISSFLKLATLYLDMLHKTIHRIRQILDFDWIDEETQNKLIKNLDVLLKNKI
jgi:hypothetical protein